MWDDQQSSHCELSCMSAYTIFLAAELLLWIKALYGRTAARNQLNCRGPRPHSLITHHEGVVSMTIIILFSTISSHFLLLQTVCYRESEREREREGERKTSLTSMFLYALKEPDMIDMGYVSQMIFQKWVGFTDYRSWNSLRALYTSCKQTRQS